MVVAKLTGLERDASALPETMALNTHERRGRADVILFGHIYAGMIITGVAEHVLQRIAHLVYVDALVREHDQPAVDILPEPTRNAFRKLAAEGGGWRRQPNAHLLDLWGLEVGSARVCPGALGGLHSTTFLSASSGALARR